MNPNDRSLSSHLESQQQQQRQQQKSFLYNIIIIITGLTDGNISIDPLKAPLTHSKKSSITQII